MKSFKGRSDSLSMFARISDDGGSCARTAFDSLRDMMRCIRNADPAQLSEIESGISASEAFREASDVERAIIKEALLLLVRCQRAK